MNKIFLMGRLTKDPEITQSTNGVNKCVFTLAVNRRFLNINGERETDFINCIAWRTNADFMKKHFNKGSQVLLIGSLQVRKYEANDGTTKIATEVLVDEIEFVGAKPQDTTEDISQKPKMLEAIEDDSLPF